MLLSNATTGTSSLIIGVYGSTNPSHRRNLWQVFINTSTTTLPWCVLGDFNATLGHDEKLSLRQPPSSSLKDFQSVVLQAGLPDVPSYGSKFTWSNNRKGLSYVAARLDRVLVNTLWLATFPDPTTHHLPRSFDSAPSSSLWNDLMSAKLGLHEALKAQEIHWKQRSQIKWLKEGNQNTKLFHQSAKARSSFNSINHISVNGTRSDDPLII
ncbi:hypothetical protein AAC387_Pa03g2254 [Persea americana]